MDKEQSQYSCPVPPVGGAMQHPVHITDTETIRECKVQLCWMG
ncbi:unnamed protein product [marine sediment metagenome]|uniref:Uncharacterized protein n=1 Tax=marine sediment metagenome TaxID=412755 RepID=X1TVY2_9ZZZZ